MARKMSATRQAAEWNKANPIGTRVRYWTGAVRGPGRESTTRGAAFVQTSGHVSIHVVGFASSIALSHVEVIGPPVSVAAAARSADVRARLSGLASEMDPAARATLGLDEPLTTADQRLISDVTAPPIIHLLKTAPSVETLCGAPSGHPGVFTRGADAFLALPVSERCPTCDARKREPDSPAAYPTTPPPAMQGRLAYVDQWGVHGVSFRVTECGCRVEGAGNSPDPVRIEPCLMHRPPHADDTAHALAGALDAFAIRLNKAPPCADRQEVDGRKIACIVRLGRDALGHRVPFHRMNPLAMCHACCALWHVQMAEQQLRTLATIEAEQASEAASPK